jgi:hypothetical protein
VGWVALIVVVVVSALGYLLDRFLAREGMSRGGMLLLTNSITGIVAGTFVYSLVKQEKAVRELMRERVRTIAELNHHIRNALQVIKFYGSAQGRCPESSPMQLIRESADRIEWALRELLPEHPEKPPAPVPTGYAAGSAAAVQIGAFSDHTEQTRLH